MEKIEFIIKLIILLLVFVFSLFSESEYKIYMIGTIAFATIFLLIDFFIGKTAKKRKNSSKK